MVVNGLRTSFCLTQKKNKPSLLSLKRGEGGKQLVVRIASFVWFPTLTFKMLLAMEGSKTVAFWIESYVNGEKKKVACHLDISLFWFANVHSLKRKRHC